MADDVKNEEEEVAKVDTSGVDAAVDDLQAKMGPPHLDAHKYIDKIAKIREELGKLR